MNGTLVSIRTEHTHAHDPEDEHRRQLRLAQSKGQRRKERQFALFLGALGLVCALVSNLSG